MSALSSASSLDEIQAAYADAACYQEDGSASKARAFITACRLLLLQLPKRVSKGGRAQGEEVELDPGLLARQIDEAKRYLTSTAIATAPPKCFSIEGFRD